MQRESQDSPERLSLRCSAFAGPRKLLSGTVGAVALAAKAALVSDTHQPILVFDDSSGRVIDLDLRGSDEEIVARLSKPVPSYSGRYRPRPTEPDDLAPESRGRGRPRMGVIAREVTLLPRQWDWLAAQSGGASATLRRLIDEARRMDEPGRTAKLRQEAAYHFMQAMAGNLAGYEEATRALFAGDVAGLAALMAQWPEDIRAHVLFLAGIEAAA